MYYDKQVRGFSCLFLIYFLLSIPIFISSNSSLHLALVWNLFLAYIPFFLSKYIQLNTKVRSSFFISSLIIMIWLLFFPNTMYMITDFIHISDYTFYWWDSIYSPTSYTNDIILWIQFIHIAIGSLIGTLIGLISLKIIHEFFIYKTNKISAHIILLFICFISGYAIYIGRFLRFNSWDILKPFHLIKELYNEFNAFTLNFSLLFAGYILICYIIFYIVFDKENN